MGGVAAAVTAASIASRSPTRTPIRANSRPRSRSSNLWMRQRSSASSRPDSSPDRHPAPRSSMSNLQARVTASHNAFHVEGYERIEYDLVYVDGIFALDNTDLANCYRAYGRALMVVDDNVYQIYGDAIRAYFDHHRIALTRDPGADPGDGEVAGDLRTNCGSVQRFRAGAHRTRPGHRRGAYHRRRRIRLRQLPTQHAVHPNPDNADRADRRQRVHQGGGEPRQAQKPARRLPRLAEGVSRLLLPQDAARGPGTQRNGRVDQDLRWSATPRSSRCSNGTVPTCCGLDSATSRARADCVR